MKNLNEINKLIDELTEKLENFDKDPNLDQLEEDLKKLKDSLDD